MLMKYIAIQVIADYAIRNEGLPSDSFPYRDLRNVTKIICNMIMISLESKNNFYLNYCRSAQIEHILGNGFQS